MADEEKKLYITNMWVVIIFMYYLIIFFVGTYFSFDILFKVENGGVNIFESALIGSISIALTAASIAYIRKLYKLCFRYTSLQEKDDQLFLKRLGTNVYFFTRPLFSLAFSLLVVATLRSALLMSSSAENELEIGFIYICMITSFYVGFLSGEFIKKLEEKGLNKFNRILNERNS